MAGSEERDPGRWAGPPLPPHLVHSSERGTPCPPLTVDCDVIPPLQEVYVLRNTTYSYAPIGGTPYVLVIVTPSDLWLVAPPTSPPNGSSVFTLLSSEPHYQCMEENCQQYLKMVEGRPLPALHVVATGESL